MSLLTDNTMLAALLALVGLGTLFGGLLGYAAEKFKVGSDPIVQQLDELLPQTPVSYTHLTLPTSDLV